MDIKKCIWLLAVISSVLVTGTLGRPAGEPEGGTPPGDDAAAPADLGTANQEAEPTVAPVAPTEKPTPAEPAKVEKPEAIPPVVETPVATTPTPPVVGETMEKEVAPLQGDPAPAAPVPTPALPKDTVTTTAPVAPPIAPEIQKESVQPLGGAVEDPTQGETVEPLGAVPEEPIQKTNVEPLGVAVEETTEKQAVQPLETAGSDPVEPTTTQTSIVDEPVMVKEKAPLAGSPGVEEPIQPNQAAPTRAPTTKEPLVEEPTQKVKVEPDGSEPVPNGKETAPVNNAQPEPAPTTTSAPEQPREQVLEKHDVQLLGAPTGTPTEKSSPKNTTDESTKQKEGYDIVESEANIAPEHNTAEKKGNLLSTGEIVGITLGIIILIVLAIAIALFLVKKNRRRLKIYKNGGKPEHMKLSQLDDDHLEPVLA